MLEEQGAKMGPLTMKPRLLLADDHELILDGLCALLRNDFEVVGTVLDGRAAVAAFDRLLPDLLLLDIALPLLNGIEVARQVKQTTPGARILFITMQNDKNYVEEAFRAGASGYLLKQSAATELVDAIKTVLKGRFYVSPLIAKKTGALPFDSTKNPVELFGGTLTPRQREVLQLLAEGKAMKEIAEILHISVRTVEFHKNSIVQELGLRTTAELTRYAVDHGIVA
jgi:DNA-binding NarL/FixJ family response regulator